MTKDTRRGGGGRSKANSNGAHVSATFILSSPCRLLSESLSRRCLKSHLYVPFYVSAVQHGLSESGAWQKRGGMRREKTLFPVAPADQTAAVANPTHGHNAKAPPALKQQ